MADAGTQQNSLILGKNKQTGKAQPFPIDDEYQASRIMLVGGERWLVLGSGQLTGTAAVLVTAGKAYRDVRLLLSNIDPSAVYYATVYLLANGASVADSAAITKGEPVPPGKRLPPMEMALGNGDVIQGLADTASKITWFVLAKDQA